MFRTRNKVNFMHRKITTWLSTPPPHPWKLEVKNRQFWIRSSRKTLHPYFVPFARGHRPLDDFFQIQEKGRKNTERANKYGWRFGGIQFLNSEPKFESLEEEKVKTGTFSVVSKQHWFGANKTGTSKVDAISKAQKAQIWNMRRTFSPVFGPPPPPYKNAI